MERGTSEGGHQKGIGEGAGDKQARECEDKFRHKPVSCQESFQRQPLKVLVVLACGYTPAPGEVLPGDVFTENVSTSGDSRGTAGSITVETSRRLCVRLIRPVSQRAVHTVAGCPMLFASDYWLLVAHSCHYACPLLPALACFLCCSTAKA